MERDKVDVGPGNRSRDQYCNSNRGATKFAFDNRIAHPGQYNSGHKPQIRV